MYKYIKEEEEEEQQQQQQQWTMRLLYSESVYK